MDKLKIGDVRKELPFSVSKNSHFDWFETLMHRSDLSPIDFDVYLPTKGMNLQRPLVWNLHQKQQFILSILKDNPIPKVSIIKHYQLEPLTAGKIEVIDGKQRMCAFIDFCKGVFPLPTGHYFKDLDSDCRMAIFRFYSGLDCCTLYDSELTDDEKIMWFEQINFTGTPQDEAHLLALKRL